MDLNPLNLEIYIKSTYLQIYVKSADFIEIHTSVWAFNRETSRKTTCLER